jgi:HSP20 family molecular chaperone IbpA
MRINNHNIASSLENELNQFLKLGRPIVPLAQAFLGSLTHDDHSESRTPIKLVDEEDRYEVFVSLPGFSKKEISIKLENDQLLISGEKADGAVNPVVNEPNCSYSLNLPDGVETDKAKAALSNGVLTIMFPKCAKAKPREIKIS